MELPSTPVKNRGLPLNYDMEGIRVYIWLIYTGILEKIVETII